MSHLPEAAPTRSWYRIQARSDADQPKSIEVLIYDEIGLWGISAGRFIDELKAMDDGRAQITATARGYDNTMTGSGRCGSPGAQATGQEPARPPRR